MRKRREPRGGRNLRRSMEGRVHHVAAQGEGSVMSHGDNMRCRNRSQIEKERKT